MLPISPMHVTTATDSTAGPDDAGEDQPDCPGADHGDEDDGWTDPAGEDGGEDGGEEGGSR